jgi:hypothetical protein
LEHLRDRVAVHAKALGRFAAAQSVRNRCASYRGIEFHCEHPFGLSMPVNDIESAYQDRHTFAPPSQAMITGTSVVHFALAIHRLNELIKIHNELESHDES